MHKSETLDKLQEFKEAMLEPDEPTKPKNQRRNKRKGGSKRHKGGPTDMMLLELDQPKGISADNIDDYINIKATSLDMDFTKPFNTVFGEVLSIRRALDFVTRPKMRTEHLTKPKFSKDDRNHIYSQVTSLVNYWALVGYVVIERLTQDERLQKLLLNDKELISADVTSNRTFRGETTVVTMDVSNAMYLGVVREVVKCFREMADADEEERSTVFEILIRQLKRDASLSIFEGTGIIAHGL